MSRKKYNITVDVGGSSLDLSIPLDNPAILRMSALYIHGPVPIGIDPVHLNLLGPTSMMRFFDVDMGPAGINIQYWHTTEQVELPKGSVLQLFFGNADSAEVFGQIVIEPL